MSGMTCDLLLKIEVVKDETKENNWHLILNVGYNTHIPLYEDFPFEEAAQEQADTYNKEIERIAKVWCCSMVRKANSCSWLVPALKG